MGQDMTLLVTGFEMTRSLKSPHHKSGTDVRAIEQMRTEALRTTVVSRSIDDAQISIQFELEHAKAKGQALTDRLQCRFLETPKL